jgi:glycosyltransferase involved in cell wall biosynthesis
VDIICLREEETEPYRETIESVRVYRMPHSHRRGSLTRYVYEYALSIFMMGAFVSLFFFRRRYACIQTNTLPDSLVFATLFPRLLGARILLDMHEPTPELLLTKKGGQVSRRMLKLHVFLERTAMRYAHRVLTVNETLRQRFISRGADPEKIFVVRNVPPGGFEAAAPPRKPHEGLVVMTHGTVQPRYGQQVLLHALPRIRKEFPSLRVVIAGAGEFLEELKRLSAALGCDDTVTFTGLVSRQRIAKLIAEADIGVVPLIPGAFSELCQPNKLFEYIALKVPVAASRLPAIEESFTDSCVRFFRPGDAADLAGAIIQLGKDKTLRTALAEQAFARYRTLRWSRAREQYVSIVEELIGSNMAHVD